MLDIYSDITQQCAVFGGHAQLMEVDELAALRRDVKSVEVRLELLVAEGESVPGPILEIGNTNSRYRFPIGARRFVNEWNIHGPAHHCAVGTGHIANKLHKLASLLRINCLQVC